MIRIILPLRGWSIDVVAMGFYVVVLVTVYLSYKIFLIKVEPNEDVIAGENGGPDAV